MVGKTSIFTRFTKKKFKQISSKERTVEACCSNKTLSFDGLNFNLNIWDTAGEEKYHALAPLYYRDADGVLLVFDMTNSNSFNNIEKWFYEISTVLGDGFTFILCGNKCDLTDKYQVNEEGAIALAKKYGANFFLVSALLDKNINECFKTISLGII